MPHNKWLVKYRTCITFLLYQIVGWRRNFPCHQSEAVWKWRLAQRMTNGRLTSGHTPSSLRVCHWTSLFTPTYHVWQYITHLCSVCHSAPPTHTPLPQPAASFEKPDAGVKVGHSVKSYITDTSSLWLFLLLSDFFLNVRMTFFVFFYFPACFPVRLLLFVDLEIFFKRWPRSPAFLSAQSFQTHHLNTFNLWTD